MNVWSLLQPTRSPRQKPRTYVTAVDKLCLSCGQMRHPEDFHKRLLSRDGLQNYCKQCQSLRWRIRVQKDPTKRALLEQQYEALRREGNVEGNSAAPQAQSGAAQRSES